MSLGGQSVELIIIGANPSGLMLAAQLLQYGLQPTIIDSRVSSLKILPAIALEPKTLEIFKQLGIEGNLKESTRQSLEEILIKHIAVRACPIYWDTKVIEVTETGRQPKLILNKGGETVESTYRKIIIADKDQFEPKGLDEGNLVDYLSFKDPIDNTQQENLTINLSIQNAQNLGWKLAYVIMGRIEEGILNTYVEERKPVGEGNALFIRLIKKMSWLNDQDNYRDRQLSYHHSRADKVKAGDRLPYMMVYDEKKKEETDLHQWCRKPGFVLILLGTLSSHTVLIMAQWAKQKYTRYMHLYYLPYSENNAAVFELFQVNSDRTKMILVRPDMYIAYMHDIISANLIDTYMEEVMKWKP